MAVNKEEQEGEREAAGRSLSQQKHTIPDDSK